MTGEYVPDAGDIIWLNFDSQSGREQGGHRPAVVVSPAHYNGRAGFLLCCPTTTRIKGYPFEVVLAGSPRSAALTDHLRSQDWMARGATRKGRVSPAELAQIRAKLKSLIG